MKPIALSRDRLEREPPAKFVLCHHVEDDAGERIFRKGRILEADDAAALLRLPWDALHVLALGPGDVHEDEAGRRLAAAAAGDGIELGSPARGQWPLMAAGRGLLEVDADALERTNAVDGVCVFTRHAGGVVDAGEEVARARALPFAMPADDVERAERRAREADGLVRLRSFVPTRVGAVVQERLGADAGERFRRTLREKLNWFGSELLPPAFVEPDGAAIGGAVERLLADGAGLLILAGARAADPLDPALAALERVGGRMVRYGVPAHPGSFLWLARVGETPLLGAPSCGLFARATAFDAVLPPLLTDRPVGAAELIALGHGGLLAGDAAFRLPPYRPDSARGIIG